MFWFVFRSTDMAPGDDYDSYGFYGSGGGGGPNNYDRDRDRDRDGHHGGNFFSGPGGHHRGNRNRGDRDRDNDRDAGGSSVYQQASQIPDPVKNFLLVFKHALSERNIYQIQNIYETGHFYDFRFFVWHFLWILVTFNRIRQNDGTIFQNTAVAKCRWRWRFGGLRSSGCSLFS